MAISKSSRGWLVDSQPAGRGGKRFRKTFPTKAEALVWEAWLKTTVTQTPAWQPEKSDLRKLSDLVDAWWNCHGKQLRAGENTKSRLDLMVAAMGNPLAKTFKAGDFSKYRATRIESGIALNSVNREHAYLRSVFNELHRQGEWKHPNPLADLRQFKIQETELSWLNGEEIIKLRDALEASSNVHTLLVARVCLSTGARWSEAEGLEIRQVKAGGIIFSQTKSGKVRSVPISESLTQELIAHHKGHGQQKRIFQTCYSAFREAVDRSGLVLPDGQLTHVLRHTFASHFMQRGGNILALQRILGHANLTMTMRYAHLAPEHLAEAVRLNPLAPVSALTLG